MDSQVPFGTPWPYRRWRLSRSLCVVAAALVAVLAVLLFGFGYPGDVGCHSEEIYNSWSGLTVDDVRDHNPGLTVHVVGTDRTDDPGSEVTVPMEGYILHANNLQARQITDVSTCRPAGTRTFADVYVRVVE